MKFKLALCQIGGSTDKNELRKIAEAHVREAAENGAQVITLPEMWDCPYSNDYFREYAEPADGETVEFMSRLAADLGIYLIGGSISELDGDKVYNTSFSFDRKGDLIGRHRKVHLFDIDVEGGIRFMESDTLTAGQDMTVIETEYCPIGVAICYDVRFPEWFRKMALEPLTIRSISRQTLPPEMRTESMFPTVTPVLPVHGANSSLTPTKSSRSSMAT